VTVPSSAAAPAAPSAAPADPAVFDPARVALLLDDPRLAAVKAQVEREAYAKAAAELGDALTKTTPLSPEDRRAWLYQLGHLRALGGDPAGAASAFKESASSPWVLADYAHLQAAQWFVGVGQFDAALAEAQAIGKGAPIDGAIDLVIADARLGKRDIDGAAARWRAYLGREAHPSGWVSIALRFASALLQYPSEAHAEEAVQLARRVKYESSGGLGSDKAKEIEKQALSTLSHDRRKALDKAISDDLLDRAKKLAASGQSREAVLVTDRLVRMPRAKKPNAFSCEVFITRAEALVKMRKKPEAADVYKEAIERCAGEPDRRVVALFTGGRASARAGRHVEAMERYALLEKEFPQHRFADDARLLGAKAAEDAGDEARFERMLSRIADDYPVGDMGTDGLFLLALHRIAKRDWAGAIGPLERALGRSPHERAYADAGRLPYFLARAHIATGAVDKGLGELVGVIRDYPLSYYMALAFARLGERDRAAAERALAEAAAREPEGPFTIARGAWSEDPAFLRAVELVRQGDAKLAKAELDRLGVGARSAPSELLWASAFLFAKAGSLTMSHGLLRTGMTTNTPRGNDLVEWLDHYPTGKWRAAWELAYPRPFADVVATEAKKNSLPEAWAYAIMREESAFAERVVSPANAYGLMQLIVPTAKRMATPLGLPWDGESLKRPEVNIALGCRYLSYLRGQFQDNPLLAIPGYNAGGGAPKRWVQERPGEDFDLWVERIPYEETRMYTKRVITSLVAYEFLYASEQPSEARSTPLSASPSAKAALAAP